MTTLFLAVLLLGQTQEFTGTVTSVHDGDTARVTKEDGTVVNVAPEIDQPRLNKEVRVVSPGTDEYGRTLGEIFVEQDGEEVSVNKESIRNGHAWWFWHYDKDESNGTLEVEAKKEERGLFASETPIYPRNWRRGARIVGSGGGGESDFTSTVFIMAVLPDPSGVDANNETVILANSSNADASIDQWKLLDDDGGEMPLSGVVPAGGAFTVRLTSSLQLGNNGDAVLLRNSQGETVQTLQYSSASRGRFVLASP